MKKIYFPVLFAIILTAVNAQSTLQVLDPDNNHNNVSNGVYDAWGDPSTHIEKEFDVRNTTSAGKTVKLKRTFVSGFNFSLPDQDTVQICWNVCLPASWNTTQTAGNVTVNANTTLSFSSGGIGFHSLFSPCALLGTRVIRYTFWDVNNTSDSVNVTVNYHITGVGINSSNIKQFNFSSPQPNPAFGQTTIRYNFPFNVGNAKIKIYNAVGTLVKEFKIEDESGKLIISTDELINGIYFYSLIINDKVAGTKKLIVAN
ncbi:MAG: T9SS type A sorting domain-containing protein [Bacteroidota bacterium]|jgi:hypothetical protein